MASKPIKLAACVFAAFATLTYSLDEMGVTMASDGLEKGLLDCKKLLRFQQYVGGKTKNQARAEANVQEIINLGGFYVKLAQRLRRTEEVPDEKVKAALLPVMETNTPVGTDGVQKHLKAFLPADTMRKVDMGTMEILGVGSVGQVVSLKVDGEMRIFKMTFPKVETMFKEHFEDIRGCQRRGLFKDQMLDDFLNVLIGMETQVMQEFDMSAEAEKSEAGRQGVHNCVSDLDIGRAPVESGVLAPLKMQVLVPKVKAHGRYLMEQEEAGGDSLETILARLASLKDRLPDLGPLVAAAENVGIRGALNISIFGQDKLSEAMQKLSPHYRNLADVAHLLGDFPGLAAYLQGGVPVLGCLAFTQEVMHGDPHPGNIRFDAATNQLWLIDWGAAISLQEDQRVSFRKAVSLISHRSYVRPDASRFVGGVDVEGAAEHGIGNLFPGLSLDLTVKALKFALASARFPYEKLWAEDAAKLMEESPDVAALLWVALQTIEPIVREALAALEGLTLGDTSVAASWGLDKMKDVGLLTLWSGVANLPEMRRLRALVPTPENLPEMSEIMPSGPHEGGWVDWFARPFSWAPTFYDMVWDMRDDMVLVHGQPAIIHATTAIVEIKLELCGSVQRGRDHVDSMVHHSRALSKDLHEYDEGEFQQRSNREADLRQKLARFASRPAQAFRRLVLDSEPTREISAQEQQTAHGKSEWRNGCARRFKCCQHEGSTRQACVKISDISRFFVSKNGACNYFKPGAKPAKWTLWRRSTEACTRSAESYEVTRGTFRMIREGCEASYKCCVAPAADGAHDIGPSDRACVRRADLAAAFGNNDASDECAAFKPQQGRPKPWIGSIKWASSKAYDCLGAFRYVSASDVVQGTFKRLHGDKGLYEQLKKEFLHEASLVMGNLPRFAGGVAL